MGQLLFPEVSPNKSMTGVANCYNTENNWEIKRSSYISKSQNSDVNLWPLFHSMYNFQLTYLNWNFIVSSQCFGLMIDLQRTEERYICSSHQQGDPQQNADGLNTCPALSVPCHGDSQWEFTWKRFVKLRLQLYILARPL